VIILAFKICGSCVSSIGNVRENNEDNFYFDGEFLNEKNNGTEEVISLSFSSENNKVFAIFDGMGGHDNGERASYLAAASLKEYLDSRIKVDWDIFSTIANKKICKEMLKNKKIMGTTMAAVQFCDDKVYISNLGDSRIYLLNKKKLTQISEDHTENNMRKNIVKNSSGKSRLTQYMGIREEDMIIQPFQKEIDYKNIDKILICSDGVTDMITDTEIKKVLINNEANECVSLLLKKALDNGGEDNTTLMVFDVIKEKVKKENRKEKKKNESFISKALKWLKS